MTAPGFGVNSAVDQLLFDVFATAMEGGVDSWASLAVYHIWVDARAPEPVEDVAAFMAVVEDASGDNDFDDSRVDRSVMACGFERLAAGPVEHVSEVQRVRLVALWAAALAGLGQGDFDAGDADVVVQVGLFNEATYG